MSLGTAITGAVTSLMNRLQLFDADALLASVTVTVAVTPPSCWYPRCGALKVIEGVVRLPMPRIGSALFWFQAKVTGPSASEVALASSVTDCPSLTLSTPPGHTSAARGGSLVQTMLTFLSIEFDSAPSDTVRRNVKVVVALTL